MVQRWFPPPPLPNISRGLASVKVPVLFCLLLMHCMVLFHSVLASTYMERTLHCVPFKFVGKYVFKYICTSGLLWSTFVGCKGGSQNLYWLAHRGCNACHKLPWIAVQLQRDSSRLIFLKIKSWGWKGNTCSSVGKMQNACRVRTFQAELKLSLDAFLLRIVKTIIKRGIYSGNTVGVADINVQILELLTR